MNWMLLVQIFGINLVYIMLNTIRTLLTMKGYRKSAVCLSVMEVTIYTLGLSMVMAYLSNPVYLVAYALGFGVGVYCGMLIEDWMALGYSVVQIFSQNADHTLPNALRERGYGLTVQPGYGRDGDRLILTVLTPRSNEGNLRRTIDEIDNKAFYISYDARYIHGGFWTKRVNPPKIEEYVEKDMQAEEIVVDEIPDKDTYLEEATESLQDKDE